MQCLGPSITVGRNLIGRYIQAPRKQQAVDSGQWAEGSGQESGTCIVDSGQWAVDSGQWAVGRTGQWIVTEIHGYWTQTTRCSADLTFSLSIFSSITNVS
jgi:hypothetical protein